MRNRKRVVVKEEKEQLIDDALERIDEEVEDRRLRGFDIYDSRRLWWKEFCIILLPLCFWMILFLSVLIFWPVTQVLTELPHSNAVPNYDNSRIQGRQLIFNETLAILTTKN